MKMFLKKLYHNIVDGGLTKKEYRSVTALYNQTNYRLWRLLLILSCVVFTVLFGMSFVMPVVIEYRYIYLGMAVYSLIAAPLYCFWVKDYKRYLVKTFIYTTCAVVFTFGILVGVYSSGDELSVTFMVMLVTVPLLVLDKPWRLIAMNLVAAAAYCIVAVCVKTEEIRRVEILNTLIFASLSCILNTYLVCSRFKGFLEESILKQRVYVDALTGLGSELSYLAMSESINNMIAADKCEPFAVVMMDLNNVKKTNDTYGHIYGCAMIVEAAQYIKNLFRNSKTYHIGGDEYIAILKDKDYENINALLRDFDRKMENYYFNKNGLDLRIVVARGVAVYEKNVDRNFRDVLQKADDRMYENKRFVKELYGMEER